MHGAQFQGDISTPANTQTHKVCTCVRLVRANVCVCVSVADRPGRLSGQVLCSGGGVGSGVGAIALAVPSGSVEGDKIILSATNAHTHAQTNTRTDTNTRSFDCGRTSGNSYRHTNRLRWSLRMDEKERERQRSMRPRYPTDSRFLIGIARQYCDLPCRNSCKYCGWLVTETERHLSSWRQMTKFAVAECGQGELSGRCGTETARSQKVFQSNPSIFESACCRCRCRIRIASNVN